jgi:hypothetical protein
MNENEKNDALEELKMLSVVIGRREAAVHSRQNWLFTIFGGISLLYLKREPYLDGCEYLLVTLTLLTVFYIAEIIERVPAYRAINRSLDIEECLKGNRKWEGITMSYNLRHGKGAKDFFAFFYRVRILAPYVVMALLAILLFYNRR